MRPRILFVTYMPPGPETGATQRTHLLLSALRDVGDVDILFIRRPLYSFVSAGTLAPHCRRAVIVDATPPGGHGWWRFARPADPELVDHFAELLRPYRNHYATDPAVYAAAREMASQPYDLVVGRYLAPVARSGAAHLAPAILDLDDHDVSSFQAFAASGSQHWRARAVNRFRLWQLKRFMPDLLGVFRHVWVANQHDIDRIGVPGSLLSNIPFAPPSRLSTPTLAAPPRLLFVGSLAYPVNVRGVQDFLSHAWPRIREAEPATVFQIAGGGLPEEAARRWRSLPGVELLGFVEDIEGTYANASLVVMPVDTGAGSNIKVLEALAHGRPLVATSYAVAPYADNLRDPEHLLSATGPDAFADACLRVIRTPDEFRGMARCGRDVVMEHYSSDAFKARVRLDVRRVIEDAA